jgi:hypothetical protein
VPHLLPVLRTGSSSCSPSDRRASRPISGLSTRKGTYCLLDHRPQQPQLFHAHFQRSQVGAWRWIGLRVVEEQYRAAAVVPVNQHGPSLRLVSISVRAARTVRRVSQRRPWCPHRASCPPNAGPDSHGLPFPVCRMLSRARR